MFAFFDFSEHTRLNQSPGLKAVSCIMPRATDDELQFLLRDKSHQFASLGGGERHRFLQQDVTAAFQCGHRLREVDVSSHKPETAYAPKQVKAI